MVYKQQLKTMLLTGFLCGLSPLFGQTNSGEVNQAIQTNNTSITANSTFYFDVAQDNGYPFYTEQISSFMNSFQPDYVFGKELALNSDQQSALDSLQTKYIPVTVTIQNNSSNAITMPQSGYLAELAPFMVPASTILACYPPFTDLKYKMDVRNYSCWGGVPALLFTTILCAGFAGSDKPDENDPKKRISFRTVHPILWWLLASVAGISFVATFFAGILGAVRSMKVPPSVMILDANNTDFFAQMNELLSRLSAAQITDAGGNPSSLAQQPSSFTIPAHGKFTQMIFVDATSINAAGMPATLTLNYK